MSGSLGLVSEMGGPSDLLKQDHYQELADASREWGLLLADNM